MAVRDIIKHIEEHPGGAASWLRFFGKDRRTGRTFFLPTEEEITTDDYLTVRNFFAHHKVELSPAAKKARRVAEATTAQNQ